MANQLSQGATSGMEGVVKKLGEKAGRPSGQSQTHIVKFQ